MQRLKDLLTQKELKEYILNKTNEYFQIENIIYTANNNKMRYNTIYPVILNGKITLLLRVKRSYYIVSFLDNYWYQFKATKKNFKEIGKLSKNDLLFILDNYSKKDDINEF